MDQLEMYRNLANQNGFTLMEMLIVLSIVSLLFLILPSINIKSLENQQDKQFLETFKFDVLYVQNMSTLVTTDKAYIRIYKDHYKIRQKDKIIAERPYPKGLSINHAGHGDIRFHEKGTFIYPRTMIITTRHAVYKAVFQPGKGRFYIAKQ